MQREAPFDSQRRTHTSEAHGGETRNIKYAGSKHQAPSGRVIHLKACNLNGHIDVAGGRICRIEADVASELLKERVHRHDAERVGRVGDGGVRGGQGQGHGPVLGCRMRCRKADGADGGCAQRRNMPHCALLRAKTGLGRLRPNP